MEKQQERNNSDYYVIDVMHILKSLWRRAWLIVLCGLLAGGAGFSISTFLVEPTYSSYIKLYVNNIEYNAHDDKNFSASSSELTAAQSLVKTYGDILDSRTTLEAVIAKAGIEHYTWKDLSRMISCRSSNETEIFKVTVISKDPYEASAIANTIAVVLPQRISQIINGASVEIVDLAVPDLHKVAPSRSAYTVVGGLIGALIPIIILVILALLDDTIHDEEFILQSYEYPILGKVPNLLGAGKSAYRYRSYRAYRAYKSYRTYQTPTPQDSDNENK